MSDGEKPNTRDRLDVLAPGFGKRVKEAVDSLGGVAAAVKAGLPLGENQIRRVQNEETVPSFPAIAVLAKLSGYRTEWLAFADEPARHEAPSDLSKLPGEMQATPFYWVPELDARAAAGRGVMNDEIPEIKAAFPIPRAMIDNMRLDPARLRILQSDGTSMEPDIRHGDHMVIVTGEETLIDGAIYVLNAGEDTLVKQVQLDPTGGLTLISKNPSFPPRPVSPVDRDQLSFAGRVVMTLKRFG